MKDQHLTYWQMIWAQFKKHRLGQISLYFVVILSIVGVYAPFLASSKPIVLFYDGKFYFPLFRYLFFTGFFTKPIDLFYNIFMFVLPLGTLAYLFFRRWFKPIALFLTAAQLALFLYLWSGVVTDPTSDPVLNEKRQEALQGERDPFKYSWEFDLSFMNDYARLDRILHEKLRKSQHQRLLKNSSSYGEEALNRYLLAEVTKLKSRLREEGSKIPEFSKLKEQALSLVTEKKMREITTLPTLWFVQKLNRARELLKLQGELEVNPDREVARAKLKRIAERNRWIEAETEKLGFVLMPLIRDYHWEDDAGGEQSLNKHLPWYERSRINRKDLLAALIFGIRISLVVGLLSVGLALAIGVPVGALAGYYGGKFDIVVSRLLEIWESMPTFFMLLMVVAITQSKSIFLVIAVIGIFGWTGFSRFVRGEFFKQRNLSYVDACHSLGFSDRRIIFYHILPNAIPPLLTMLPFAIMGAITSEAGLSFLGLGEEGSCSWGVLMDEGRAAFPGESYLLWPPAMILTALLVGIALIGDAMRDALDPKMHR